MRKIEIIFPVIAIFGFFVYLMDWPFGTEIIILSLLILSCFYFYLGVLLLNAISFKKMFKKDSYSSISVKRIIGTIGAGVGISIVILGIMFKTFHWPFANQNLIIGISFLFIVITISLIKLLIKINDFYVKILFRTGIYTFLGLVFLFLPEYAIFELKNRRYPNYIEAVKNLDKNPEDPILREKEREEFNKILKGINE